MLKPALALLQEKEPMGTAGPLALARDILDDGSGDPFFVLNRCSFQPILLAAVWSASFSALGRLVHQRACVVLSIPTKCCHCWLQ